MLHSITSTVRSFIARRRAAVRAFIAARVDSIVARFAPAIAAQLLGNSDVRCDIESHVKCVVEEVTEELDFDKQIERAFENADFSQALEEWSQSRDGQRALKSLVESELDGIDVSDVIGELDDDELIEAIAEKIEQSGEIHRLIAKSLRDIADRAESV